MVDDPKECRANARQCIELAAKVKYPELRATFLELARKWTKFAAEMERPRKPTRRRLASKKRRRI
jgi:hypothetical protein